MGIVTLEDVFSTTFKKKGELKLVEIAADLSKNTENLNYTS